MQLSIARLVVFSVPFVWNPLVQVGWMILPRLDGAAGGIESAFLHLVAYSLAVVILDPAVAALERVPLVRRLFHFSWTARFRRYLAPGFQAECQHR